VTAAGEQVSVRTLGRMRQRYESQGLWGLVDHRDGAAREASSSRSPELPSSLRTNKAPGQGHGKVVK
jgi:hypothetical protein